VRAVALLVLVAGACAAAAQGTDTVYRSVGPDGRVTYSQTPPDKGQVDRKMEFSKLPATPLPAHLLQFRKDVSRLAAEALAPPAELRLFTASWCGYCRQSKAWLRANGMAFTEFDIEQPGVMAEFARAGGTGSVPLLVGPNVRLQGFTRDGYAAALGAPRKP
jgi:glutaredoxin